MRSASGITHQSDELEILRRVNLFSELDRRPTGFDSMPGQARIDVHDGPDVDTFGGRRFLQPPGGEWIVNDRAEGRFSPGKSNGPANVVLAGRLPRQEHTLDTFIDHEFTFRH